MRELRVLRCAAGGKGTRATALEMHYSTHTIKRDWLRIHRKLGTSNRTHAVAIAFRAGLL